VLCYVLSKYHTMILGCGKVMCGEWEVGSVPASWSGELYNIILDVQRIILHPLYNVSAVKSLPPLFLGKRFPALCFDNSTSSLLCNVTADMLSCVAIVNQIPCCDLIIPHPIYNVSVGKPCPYGFDNSKSAHYIESLVSHCPYFALIILYLHFSR